MRTKILFACLLSYLSVVYADSQANKVFAPLFNNLSNYHHAISTKVPLAQRYFDQGLVLFYGFEWGEAIRSFKAATLLDPQCGMCYWGLALALSAKANAPMSGYEYQEGENAIKQALTLTAQLPSVEQGYIRALAQWFKRATKQNSKSGVFNCHTTGNFATEQGRLDYVNAMAKLGLQYPNDPDAQALFVFALFDVLEWIFWDKAGNPSEDTLTILDTLNNILARDALHPGANHYSIHVLEASPHPEVANINAQRLHSLVPGSEHMVHMPAHIEFLTGRYHEATLSNQRAIEVYQKYSRDCKAQGFAPEITYLYQHDFDFLRSTAAMEGRQQLALDAAQELIRNLPQKLVAQEPDLQGFIPIPYFVEARFGLWNNLLREPKPNIAYQYALGMWYYTQGLALAQTGDTKKAKLAEQQLQAIIKKSLEPAVKLNLLKIADAVLNAVLANVSGDEKSTISHLKNALQIQNAMGYHEPPDWYFPVRQALGDAYLKWHHPKEAIEIYQQDLQQYPNNGWSLYGLSKSYEQLGDQRKAKQAAAEFKKAWQYADISKPVNLF